MDASSDNLALYGAIIGTLALLVSLVSAGWQVWTYYETPRISVFGPQRLAGGAAGNFTPTMRGSSVQYRVVLVNNRSRPVSIVNGMVTGVLRGENVTVEVDNYERTGFSERPGFPLLLEPGAAVPIDLLLTFRAGRDGFPNNVRDLFEATRKFRGALMLILTTSGGLTEATVDVEIESGYIAAAVGMSVPPG